MKPGIVYLIGAGPGDPGLITVKGLEHLRHADVVVYDYLANPVLLDQARPDAEIVYVGKKAGQHTLTQGQINDLLVAKARQGHSVARLKGGDPFVFGRGGEEAEALAEAGIPFEVVPGVTSAVAAPAYAGIPITHRDHAPSFAVVTGHRKRATASDGEDSTPDVDWAALAGIGTVVFLMGVGNLPHIVDNLLAHGRSPDTPVALVRWGTTPQQETVAGTLTSIVDEVKAAGIKPPAVVVVGGVAGLRDKLRWFDTKPLFGRRVLVTRSRTQASALSERLRDLGAEPVEFPVIRIAPPADFGPLDEAIARLVRGSLAYDWVIFTSANGVEAFAERLWTLGHDVRALAGCKLCAIGPATAEALRQLHLQVDLIPAQYVAESIVEDIGDVRDQRILLPRADIARPTLPTLLRRKGADVDEVTAYRTVPDGDVTGRAGELLSDVDTITFTSSSTVRNLVELAQGVDLGAALNDTLVACIGPITAGTARELGLRVDLIAAEYTIEGLVEALVREASSRIERVSSS